MKQIKVTEKSGASITYLDSGDIIDKLTLMGHGLPERWVNKDSEHDPADVLEEREVELQSAIPAQEELIDSYGNMLQPAIEAVPAVMLKQVKLRAQYTVEIVDITEEVEQQKINQEALAYLAETDWMVIRQMDSGEPMPAEVKAKRAEARAKVKR